MTVNICKCRHALLAVVAALPVLLLHSPVARAASLDYSTYFGKGGTTVISNVARDSYGFTYIVGATESPENFPVTAGAYDTAYNGGAKDAFVAKISPQNEIVFCTYLGGSGEDYGRGIAVDLSGYIYVTGATYSQDFPTTDGAWDRSLNGERDAFVVKLAPAGKRIIYSTYLGGNAWDYGKTIAVDYKNCAHIGGFTHGDFPVTTYAAQKTFGGAGDGFITRLNAKGSAPVYSTYIGGLSWDGVNAICVDAARNVFIAGDTHSSNFPVTAGAYDTDTSPLQGNVCSSGYAAKLNATGARFTYATLIGGKTSPASAGMSAIALDSRGRACVAGATSAPDYPVSLSACQKTYGGGAYDGVITKLNAYGTGVIWSTYLGGSGDDRVYSISVDTVTNTVFAAGSASSSDFPIAGAASFQPANNGLNDAFAAMLKYDGSTLLSSTYLGGSGREGDADTTALSLLPDKTVFIAGKTSSSDFPTTPAALQPIYGGGDTNGFFSVINLVMAQEYNRKPVALAGHDVFVETDSDNAAVTLDGSQSYDPDAGDSIASYKWYGAGGSLLATGPAPTLTLSKGIHHIYLVVSDGSLNSDMFVEDTERDSSVAVAVSEGVFRINCGAETFDYTDPRGGWWMRDEAFYSLYRWGNIGGNAAGVYPGEIYNTGTPEIFKTNRFGGTDMHYRIEVPNGSYAVKLLMAETWWTEPGKRSFDVAVEGNVILRNVDLYAWRGFATAYERTVLVQVNDQAIDIDFPSVYADNALISAIEVAQVSVADEAFLDFIQKKMFWYFWNECDPATGLIKDKEDNWAPGSETVGSIATTGMGLSVLTIAANRGWVTKEEAYLRVKATLNTFLNNPNFFNKEGFWYHFVDIHTGQRSGASEVSTVDSALFILGAIQAAEYFKSVGYDPDNIYKMADDLYRRMNWKYYTGTGNDYQKQFVSMGWAPEDNALFGALWENYCESVFVNLLALGAPDEDFRISTSAWTSMGRDCIDAYGYMHARSAPLFIHQYHNLYFDFRDKDDGFMDYFETAKYATHTNRLGCLDDEGLGYEADAWGATACYGLDGGYHVYGSPDGWHDGTIAPTAAGASIMFTPGESTRALRRMFFKYKQWNWGRHGFADSFKTNVNAKCPYALGLDNAPLIIGIENYRTGLVRNTTMANPHLQAALGRAGFEAGSLRRLAFASSHEAVWENADPSLVLPARAFDGDMSTRWSSQHGSDPQWLCIDYRDVRTVDKVTIAWEAAYATAYKVQTSLDGHEWTDVYSTAAGDGGTDVIMFEPVQARFVRLHGTQRVNAEWGYSVWEMNVSGSTVTVASAAAPLYAPLDPEFKAGEIYSFPNPARNGANPTIHVECGLADTVEFNFYDISGAAVRSALVSSQPSVIRDMYVYEYTLDTSNLASGVYLCHITARKDGKDPIKILKKLAVIK